MHISFSRQKNNNCDPILKQNNNDKKNTLVYIVSQADHSNKYCKKYRLSKLSLSVVINI